MYKVFRFIVNIIQIKSYLSTLYIEPTHPPQCTALTTLDPLLELECEEELESITILMESQATLTGEEPESMAMLELLEPVSLWQSVGEIYQSWSPCQTRWARTGKSILLM
jgi:hypothetical protein